MIRFTVPTNGRIVRGILWKKSEVNEKVLIDGEQLANKYV